MKSLMLDKHIWEFQEHNERVTMCYTKESMKHPAKMHLALCREIIKCYSEPGGKFKVTQEILDYWDSKIEWSKDES